jgi:hypothetical protein
MESAPLNLLVFHLILHLLDLSAFLVFKLCHSLSEVLLIKLLL